MNEVTKDRRQMLGPFEYTKYEEDNEQEDPELEKRGPLELDNQAIYVGQWSKNGFRHGKGT